MGRWSGRPHRGDAGASAVELALVLPILLFVLMLALTGSLSYNRKVTLTHAARETARWGATLNATLDADNSIATSWFTQLVARAEATSQGELADGEGGRYVCVAYVETGTFDPDGEEDPPDPSDNIERTWMYEESASGTSKTAGETCFDDGVTTGEARIQVEVGRDARLDAVLLRRDVALRSEAVARHEHDSPYDAETTP